MNPLPLSDAIKDFLARSVCVAVNVLQPPSVRAAFKLKDQVQDLGIQSGFDPEHSIVLAMDYNSERQELVLVWIEDDALLQQTGGGKHA